MKLLATVVRDAKDAGLPWDFSRIWQDFRQHMESEALFPSKIKEKQGQFLKAVTKIPRGHREMFEGLVALREIFESVSMNFVEEFTTAIIIFSSIL